MGELCRGVPGPGSSRNPPWPGSLGLCGLVPVLKSQNPKLPWGSTLNSYFWDEWDLGLYWTVEMDLALVLVLMLVLMLVLVSVWVLK